MVDFASPDLIQLPRLSGQEAADLIGEILAVARMKQPSLPPSIERSAERLRIAYTALENTLHSALNGPSSSTSPLSSRSPHSVRGSMPSTGPISSRGSFPSGPISSRAPFPSAGPVSSRAPFPSTGPISSRAPFPSTGPISSRTPFPASALASNGPTSSRGPMTVRSPLSGQVPQIPPAPRSNPAVPSNIRRRADRLLDSAWEATFDWLSGWCKLADEANPHRHIARELFELIFADALAFGTLPYKIEFVQSRDRLASIDLEGHEATFATLGGAAFLVHLRSVHAALQVIVRQETVIDCHEELATAAGALRQYVMRVSSHADGEIPGSEELTKALMAPLDRWHKLHPARPPEDAFGAVEETLF